MRDPSTISAEDMTRAKALAAWEIAEALFEWQQLVTKPEHLALLGPAYKQDFESPRTFADRAARVIWLHFMGGLRA